MTTFDGILRRSAVVICLCRPGRFTYNGAGQEDVSTRDWLVDRAPGRRDIGIDHNRLPRLFFARSATFVTGSLLLMTDAGETSRSTTNNLVVPRNIRHPITYGCSSTQLHSTSMYLASVRYGLCSYALMMTMRLRHSPEIQ